MRPAPAAAVLGLALPALGQSTADRLDAHPDASAIARRTVRAAERLLADSGVPGAAIAVRMPGHVTQHVLGVQDLRSGQPMEPPARMPAGSVGKTFVAALALSLVREGELDLDAPIATYLGEREWFERLPNARATTPRMLMNHTSGLVRYEFDARFTADLQEDPYRAWAVEEQLAYLFDGQAPFAAGDRFEYSDTNYLVLGMILEALTGEPLFDTLETRWVDQLGLENTVRSAGRSIEGLIQGHVAPNDPLVRREVTIVEGELPFDPAFEGAGGGWVTTASDLARWARHLWREGGAIADELRDELLDGVPAPQLGPGVRYGLGVILRDGEHGQSLGHSGYFPGYLTEVRYWPEHDLAIAVQVNSSRINALRTPPARWVEELAAAVLAD